MALINCETEIDLTWSTNHKYIALLKYLLIQVEKQQQQPQNNNLDHMIDPTFRNIKRLFVSLFRNGANNPTMLPFDRYYRPLVEIKDFKVLIDNKLFFDQPVNINKKYMKNSSNCQEMMTIQLIRLIVPSKIL